MEFSVKNKFQLKLEINSVELQRLYVIIWNNKDTGSYNSVRIQDIFMNTVIGIMIHCSDLPDLITFIRVKPYFI